jgi:hypothetical protein
MYTKFQSKNLKEETSWERNVDEDNVKMYLNRYEKYCVCWTKMAQNSVERVLLWKRQRIFGYHKSKRISSSTE